MSMSPHNDMMMLEEARLFLERRGPQRKPFFSFRTRKFLSYYRPYWGLFLADMICALMVSIITLLLPLCTRYITKNILEQGVSDALNQIYFMALFMLGLLILHTLCNMFICYQGHMMGAKMESDMRRELFDHYQKLSFSFYDDQKTGQLLSRITNDAFWPTELFHHGPEDLVICLVKIVGTFIILMNINAKLTMALFLFIPVMAIYAFYYNKKMNRALRRSKDRIGDVNAQVEDTLSGIRVVKSFANEDLEMKKFLLENERFLESRREGYKSETLFHEGVFAMTQLMTMIVVIFGAFNIVHGSLDLADLITYLMCVAIFIEPIQKLTNFATLYQEGMTAFDRFVEMLTIKPDIKDSVKAIDVKEVQGEIEFKGIHFKYRSDLPYIIKNFSLKIKPGEFVAVIGPSGVGKTTLCSLIPRFYEVDEGEILLDGVNIKNISLASLRKNIGIVQQDIYLFAGTVEENIRYGDPHAKFEEVVEAAKKANAHEFIMQFPEGYQTDIGQRGVKISGGQKQRLTIARLFLKNPPILILDEATSALDRECEKIIQESLETLVQNRTTIVITHRLSIIEKAHSVIHLSSSHQ